MCLNEFGQIAYHEWLKTAKIRDNVLLGPFVIMPNHMHGIITISNDEEVKGLENVFIKSQFQFEEKIPFKSPSKTIGAIIRGFKVSVSIKINRIRKLKGAKIWHRNYWDNIIRTEKDHRRISDYILTNPAKWDEDRFYFNSKL